MNLMEEFKAVVCACFFRVYAIEWNIVGAKIILKGICVFALGAALFSCKRKVVVELAEYTPLSKEAGDLSAGAQWTYEIESGRLDKKIDSFEAISKNVVMAPLTIAALDSVASMASVWPELDGFGSLDVSNIQGELLETIKTFCLDMLEYSKSAAEYEKYQAAKKAAAKNGSESSGEEEPAEDEDVPKKDSSKIDAAFSSRSLFSLAFFLADSREAGVLQSFVIGRPFVGEETIEVPARWTGQKQILYTKLYPVQEGESWKIQQIEIYKSEANDGSGKTDRN